MLHMASQLRGYAIAALDGLLGKESDILFDDRDWRVRYFVVKTDGWLTGRHVLVPPDSVKGVSDGRAVLVTDLTRRQLEDAPALEYEAPPDPRASYDARQTEGETWPAFWGLPMLPALGFFDEPRVATPPPAAAKDEEARVRIDRWLEADPHVRSCQELRGYRLRARDGDLGHVEDFIVDPATWRLRYLVVTTRHWLPGGHRVLIAPEGVSYIDHASARVEVVFDKAAVLAAPKFDPQEFHVQH